MIIEVPIPTIVIVFPTIVATDVKELVYVKAPVLVDVGAVIVKGVFLFVFTGIEKPVRTGVPLLTTSDAVIVPDV